MVVVRIVTTTTGKGDDVEEQYEGKNRRHSPERSVLSSLASSQTPDKRGPGMLLTILSFSLSLLLSFATTQGTTFETCRKTQKFWNSRDSSSGDFLNLPKCSLSIFSLRLGWSSGSPWSDSPSGWFFLLELLKEQRTWPEILASQYSFVFVTTINI